MKPCSNCFLVKPYSEFYLKRPKGHQSRCKACNAEVVRGYAQRQRIKLIARGWNKLFNRPENERK